MTLLEFEEVMNVITAQNPGLLQKEMTGYKKPVYHLGSTEISYSKTYEDTVFAQINRIPLEVARIIYKEYAKPLYGIKLLQKSYIEKSNPNPDDYAIDEIYEKSMQNYYKFGQEVLMKNKDTAKEKLARRPDRNKYVKNYIIDTKEGLIAVIAELESYIEQQKQRQQLHSNKIVSLNEIYSKQEQTKEQSEARIKKLLEAVQNNMLEITKSKQSTQDWLRTLNAEDLIYSILLSEPVTPEQEKLRQTLDRFDKAINPYMDKDIELKQLSDYQDLVTINASYDENKKQSVIKLSSPKETKTEFSMTEAKTVKSPDGISYELTYDYGNGMISQTKHEYNIHQGEIITMTQYFCNGISSRTIYNMTSQTIETLSTEEMKADHNTAILTEINVSLAASHAEEITTNHMVEKNHGKIMRK